MRRETFGDGDDHVIFVRGWGTNRRPSTSAGRSTASSMRTTASTPPRSRPTVPTTRSSGSSPCGDVETHPPVHSLSHSTGGLISRSLDADDLHSRVSLTPWWSFHEDLDGIGLSMLMKLPDSTPFIPADFEREELGDLATEAQVEQIPSKMAPTFPREARRG